MKSTSNHILIIAFFCGVLTFTPLFLTSQEKEKEKEKEEKQKIITEEIVVEAPLPKDFLISTTSSIKREKIESFAPRDLSDVLSFTSGTFVSNGSKNEFRIKIRGFESEKIALLYDGIPIYEPFFNSFDLKTLTSEEIESIKIVKGASSVLYGPNTLGGVVEVLTKRPNPPSFSLKTLYDSNSSFDISSSGSIRWKNLIFSGFGQFDRSNGFKWNKDGKVASRENSDYERRNVTGKLYFYPNAKSEILLEAGYYSSKFGIPWATEYYNPRYWRFKSWNRFQLNLGGTFSLLKNGNIKFRSYYVRHENVLDSYTNSEMNLLQWESAYKNDSYGSFLLGSFPLSSRYELKLSLNFRDDRARTQDGRGLEWKDFEHRTLSLGLENLFSLSARWKLVAGVSLDHLNKQSGENKTTRNPILGLKFNPTDYLDFHATYSQKSRFPSMKSLYSTQTGNPDLKDESGESYEFGARYEKKFILCAAIFYDRIKDLIKAERLPSGFQTNLNIGKAHISGFELEFEKALRWLNFSLNYTYLDGKNEDENRALDLIPKSQLNFVFGLRSRENLQFNLWALAVSSSEVKISNRIVTAPDYFVLNTMLSKDFYNFTVFLKGENIFNGSYVTEPGFPMKGRTVAFGIKYALMH